MTNERAIGVMTAMLNRLIWAWRLWWGLCPICNSDAPALDTCKCCRGEQIYPLTDDQKRLYVEYLDRLGRNSELQ